MAALDPETGDWLFEVNDWVILINDVGVWPEGFVGKITRIPDRWTDSSMRTVNIMPGAGQVRPKNALRTYLVAMPHNLAPFCRLTERPIELADPTWGQF